ncbi:hypothetical protein [Flindersiella endophytica]
MERRLDEDRNIGKALDWLDEHAGWEPGGSRRKVVALLTSQDASELHNRRVRRTRVRREDAVRALGQYYGDAVAGFGRYAGRFDGGRTETSILTSDSWLDVGAPLIPAHDRLRLTSAIPYEGPSLDEGSAAQAAERLAETLALGTRLVDMPLYRLLTADIRSGDIAGDVGMSRFVQYALTIDPLEGELLDALAAGVEPRPGSLPLRDSLLPDLASVLDLPGRLCCGGALALCAIARPATFTHPNPDYLLLVQERSSSVVNAAGRLAVIPKAFHQPLTDISGDTQIGATLRREMEEELFGRQDEIDNTMSEQRSADPMHPSRLSEPMSWLLETPGRLRMECTGFGLNLVSGNFEFASLIVIEDEEFWARFGGQIQANWEAASLRRYSSLDRGLLAELLDDPAWTSEGLFAFMQGLRRLAELNGPRVAVPTVDWELT